MSEQKIPCGGCGAEDESQRCIGCLHHFTPQRSPQKHDELTAAQQQVDNLTADNTSLLDDNVRIALERDRLRELLLECVEWLDYVPLFDLAKGE